MLEGRIVFVGIGAAIFGGCVSSPIRHGSAALLPACHWDAKPKGNCLSAIRYESLRGGGVAISGYPRCTLIVAEGHWTQNAQETKVTTIKTEKSGEILLGQLGAEPDHVEIVSCQVYPETRKSDFGGSLDRCKPSSMNDFCGLRAFK